MGFLVELSPFPSLMRCFMAFHLPLKSAQKRSDARSFEDYLRLSLIFFSSLVDETTHLFRKSLDSVAYPYIVEAKSTEIMFYGQFGYSACSGSRRQLLPKSGIYLQPFTHMKDLSTEFGC